MECVRHSSAGARTGAALRRTVSDDARFCSVTERVQLPRNKPFARDERRNAMGNRDGGAFRAVKTSEFAAIGVSEDYCDTLGHDHKSLTTIVLLASEVVDRRHAGVTPSKNFATARQIAGTNDRAPTCVVDSS
jgi:hypothetical protein